MRRIYGQVIKHYIYFSEEGSNLRETEEDTIFCWELLLNSIQEKQSTITFQEMLVFITGADSIPPLGFPGEPRIEFYTQENRRLPFASACGTVLSLPRGIREEEVLTDLLNTALKGYLGFGKI